MWQVTWEQWGSGNIGQRLADGWEPFSTTYDSTYLQHRVWFRKRDEAGAVGNG